MNPFFTLFELENSTINKTDSDDTLLTFIHGNIHTWKGCHIFMERMLAIKSVFK